MEAVLDLVQIVICVGLIFLILMHSGKDAGLSGAFGVGTGAGPLGGGSLVERNLNRWTVGFAIAFVVNTIILIKISERGCASSQRLISGVLWVEALSRTRCTSRSAGTCWSRSSKTS